MKKGFTLIELTIITVIIGTLATVGLTEFDRARKKAQDTKTRQQVKAVRDALEFYYLDRGTYYLPYTGWFHGGHGYANFLGYGYNNSHIDLLTRFGYLSNNAGIEIYRGHATWLMGDTYKNRFMIYSCPGGFTEGYSISANLNYPIASEVEDLRTQCNGTAVVNSGMHYGLQIGGDR